MKQAVTLLILAFALTSCASNTQPAGTPEAEPAPQAPADCITVDPGTIDAISAGLQTGITIAKAAAHPADGYENVTLVATELAGEGIEPGQAIAVFATNDDVTTAPHDGLIMAVPSMATEFSDWPDSSTTDAEITTTTPGVDQAKACLG